MALRDAVKEAHPRARAGRRRDGLHRPADGDDDPDAPAAASADEVRRSSRTWSTPARRRCCATCSTSSGRRRRSPLERGAAGHRHHPQPLPRAAMSHGALTGASHMTIAAAFNELGALQQQRRGRRGPLPQRRARSAPGGRSGRRCSPSGRATRRSTPRRRPRARAGSAAASARCASGRFGVDAEYLINADELQIKMAQGAKPGEGGQLMGKKVTKEIAEIRFGQAGHRPDQPAAAPRHLFDRGPGPAHLRPEGGQAGHAGVGQAGGRREHRHHRRRRGQGRGRRHRDRRHRRRHRGGDGVVARSTPACRARWAWPRPTRRWSSTACGRRSSSGSAAASRTATTSSSTPCSGPTSSASARG